MISAADDAGCRASLIIGRLHQSPFKDWKQISTGSVTAPTSLLTLALCVHCTRIRGMSPTPTTLGLDGSPSNNPKRAPQRDGNSIFEPPSHRLKARTTLSPCFASILQKSFEAIDSQQSRVKDGVTDIGNILENLVKSHTLLQQAVNLDIARFLPIQLDSSDGKDNLVKCAPSSALKTTPASNRRPYAGVARIQDGARLDIRPAKRIKGRGKRSENRLRDLLATEKSTKIILKIMRGTETHQPQRWFNYAAPGAPNGVPSFSGKLTIITIGLIEKEFFAQTGLTPIITAHPAMEPVATVVLQELSGATNRSPTRLRHESGCQGCYNPVKCTRAKRCGRCSVEPALDTGPSGHNYESVNCGGPFPADHPYCSATPKWLEGRFPAPSTATKLSLSTINPPPKIDARGERAQGAEIELVRERCPAPVCSTNWPDYSKIPESCCCHGSRKPIQPLSQVSRLKWSHPPTIDEGNEEDPLAQGPLLSHRAPRSSSTLPLPTDSDAMEIAKSS
ncbi:hypothetical protein BGHDH14_bgh00048 [Blumeria hordei DH14]|uniref:Uncharacterized protein n=1 Tax=Blumeria graminis f. sp. hordei (strain DH14) TaxID=546991 RepID=N1JAI3_BLUG1|nr:hypothetical protein BGHDH14_bgh00048 [Blumeria hordei DH14]